MDTLNLKIKKLKKELFAAVLSVGVAAVALGSSTYAWYVTNNTVDGTTSTISALANGMVLQIVEGIHQIMDQILQQLHRELDMKSVLHLPMTLKTGMSLKIGKEQM